MQVGDILKSVHLMIWREKGKRLDLLASDLNEAEVSEACEHYSTRQRVFAYEIGFGSSLCVGVFM